MGTATRLKNSQKSKAWRLLLAMLILAFMCLDGNVIATETSEDAEGKKED